MHEEVAGEGADHHTRGRVCSPRKPVVGARAFTLIEILVVVGIIGLTLTMGVPAFVRALHKEGMRKAQSDLLEACQQTRAAAIMSSNSQPRELIIKPMERTFEAPGAFPLTAFPDGVNVEGVLVNDQERDLDDVIAVRFFSRGTSDDFSIILRSVSDGSQCVIFLDPVTALADIKTSR
jgi:prepilin-type N-terminal cleavage/methylation domain-containing protein